MSVLYILEGEIVYSDSGIYDEGVRDVCKLQKM